MVHDLTSHEEIFSLGKPQKQIFGKSWESQIANGKYKNYLDGLLTTKTPPYKWPEDWSETKVGPGSAFQLRDQNGDRSVMLMLLVLALWWRWWRRRWRLQGMIWSRGQGWWSRASGNDFWGWRRRSPLASCWSDSEAHTAAYRQITASRGGECFDADTSVRDVAAAHLRR